MTPEWKPIESAPKSGRLLVWNGEPHFAVRVARPGLEGWAVEGSHQVLANVTHYAEQPTGPRHQ